MRARLFSILASFALAASPMAAKAADQPRVKLQTSMGDVVIELAPEKAPKSVANFIEYTKAGFYDGTIFHRVIPTFMVQGGGFTEKFQQKQVRAPIANEANNGLKNVRGTVAMARTNDPNSATAQFFVNVVDNEFLDFRAPTAQGWGYAVFGKVVEGMDVVDKIRNVPTGSGGPFGGDVPTKTIVIQRATVVGG